MLISYVFLDITIFPMNPEKGHGWNSNITVDALQTRVPPVGMESNDTWVDIVPTCKDHSGKKFIQCIENNTYSSKEIIRRHGESIKVEPFFMFGYVGLAHSLQIVSGETYLPTIMFNGKLRYFVHLTDPNLELFTLNPTTARTRVSLNVDEGLMLLYIKVHFKALSQSIYQN